MKNLFISLIIFLSINTFAGVCLYQIEDKEYNAGFLEVSDNEIKFNVNRMSDYAACSICKSHYRSIPLNKRAVTIYWVNGSEKEKVTSENMSQYIVKIQVEKSNRTVFCSHTFKGYQFGADLTF